ncbi:hypothetical protein DQ04_00521110 [Trypanosoma grayi]|uniref:hypothetical protein n=1 Tax=Trypanosoma grayi TaxID=71804 RepID=UPI0004F4407D|nr:hypothetical protein DQ04_00521110 [Trypanosoma grayi]KEG14326.1 hypothetical protein DQ04_00521110 [Trypanosoma grayi]
MPIAEVQPDVDSQPQPKEQQQQASTETGKKSKGSSYYYWHGHEKERAKMGDVAPLPKPQLVKKSDEIAPIAGAVMHPITKYSWSDMENTVTVYVDTLFEGKESMAPNTLQVEFKKRKLTVSYVANVETSKASVVQRTKQLVLHLSKTIKAEESSYRVKDTNGQVVLRLRKEEASAWYDLVDKNANLVDDDSADEEQPNPMEKDDDLE